MNSYQIYCDRGNGPALDGCWGSENAQFATLADAREAVRGLANLYPDCAWVVREIDGQKMTQNQAITWVRSHNDDDVLDEEELEAAFAAIFERPADDEDREQGLWSLCCAAVGCEEEEAEEEESCRFNNLEYDRTYDLIDGSTGLPLSLGIQGEEAMRLAWPEGAEAWPCGEAEFRGSPVEIAE